MRNPVLFCCSFHFIVTALGLFTQVVSSVEIDAYEDDAFCFFNALELKGSSIGSTGNVRLTNSDDSVWENGSPGDSPVSSENCGVVSEVEAQIADVNRATVWFQFIEGANHSEVVVDVESFMGQLNTFYRAHAATNGGLRVVVQCQFVVCWTDELIEVEGLGKSGVLYAQGSGTSFCKNCSDK